MLARGSPLQILLALVALAVPSVALTPSPAQALEAVTADVPTVTRGTAPVVSQLTAAFVIDRVLLAEADTASRGWRASAAPAALATGRLMSGRAAPRVAHSRDRPPSRT